MHISFLRNQPDFPNFTLDGKEINTTDKMKLLGVTLQNDLSWDIQTSQMISKASKQMYMYVLKRFKASAHDLIAVYQMYIHPVLEYASPLWHSSLTQRQIELLELIQKRAWRIVLGNEYTSYAAMETLQLCSLVERREQLLRGFGEKLFKSKHHAAMLPEPQKKRHGRNLRCAHQLDPPKCKTTRFRKSIIPAVVDRLNNAFLLCKLFFFLCILIYIYILFVVQIFQSLTVFLFFLYRIK